MRNVGTIDRILRIIVGIALLAWGVWAHNWWGALGLIPLLTALIGFCPLYAILHINTCPTKRPPEN